MDSLRASDADRERAVASLGRHAQAGRLTADELEERVGRAYAARTVSELDALHSDLPAAPHDPSGQWARGPHDPFGQWARGPHDPSGRWARGPVRPSLALLVVLLVAAGLAGTAAVGHPIAPLFLLAFLVWRLGGPRRPSAVAP